MPDKNLKAMIIKMFIGLEKRVKGISETPNKKIKKELIRDVEHNKKLKIH